MTDTASNVQPMPDPYRRAAHRDGADYERWGDVVGARQCSSSVFVQDDRWGGFTDHCDRPGGHDGEHRSRRTATKPLSWMAWHDERAEGERTDDDL